MKCPSLRAAVVVAAILINQDGRAEDFNERWSGLARNSQASVDTAPPAAAEEKKAEAKPVVQSRTRYTRRRGYRGRSSRGTRHREWYKGGKKWHYVYSRRR